MHTIFLESETSLFKAGATQRLSLCDNKITSLYCDIASNNCECGQVTKLDMMRPQHNSYEKSKLGGLLVTNQKNTSNFL